MGIVSAESVPEAILSVAEKSLSPQPLFFGLSGPQLSRIAREVYVHLRNNGKHTLAQQAKVLVDPDAIAKALQQLQQQSQLNHQQQLQQQPPQQQQQQQHHAGPCTATSCPCCMHRAALLGHHGGPIQPQILPVVVPQQQPMWQVQLPLQLQQQQQPLQQQSCTQPHHKQHPQLPHECESHTQHLHQQQQQHPQQQQRSEQLQQHPAQPQQVQGEVQQEQQQEQQQVQPKSRKACVARLLFAIIAAKLARDAMENLSGSSSSSSSDRLAYTADPSEGGMGSVSVEGLAAALSPERGFFAGLPKDLLQSLQRVISAAVDGINAAVGAAGYAPLTSQGGPRGGPTEGSEGLLDGPAVELPPLYNSKAEQGGTELSIHEKYAGELIQKLINLKNARGTESLKLKGATATRQQQQEQEQQQQQQQEQEQQHRQWEGEQHKVQVTGREHLQTQQQQQQRQQHHHHQNRRASVIPRPDDDEKALDEEFKVASVSCPCVMGYIRAAEQHKGANVLSIEQQLAFYGLYKRATAGLCPSKQPSRFNLREYKKWEAWKACNSMSALEAKKEYVRRAREVKKLHARL
ncbi:hypothetical protein, conserved [Eimeria maxima]|uniref:ACB domain-containing protein n=1 Tax=Eimeria maxima TaxID=5804 RepID=U6MFK7_EIMMA|nr:hypothetical protein, conserved [Eimeria maxima]CDJ61833.1 hypothetical protein, conserved [Eimeria maxima]